MRRSRSSSFGLASSMEELLPLMCNLRGVDGSQRCLTTSRSRPTQLRLTGSHISPKIFIHNHVSTPQPKTDPTNIAHSGSVLPPHTTACNQRFRSRMVEVWIATAGFDVECTCGTGRLSRGKIASDLSLA
ncbi:MAG: 18 kDa uknown protein [Leveillula taurica associated noda-like virus 1]|nr:MAG: 18 kDa uknown protein [Leveillula taurica associated noda-like virus 1]UTQ50826.1 MAG: 18 kDa uknown protein [Leveillula taurica associated noda-like virus 1]UTQ50829.1 MAG: 18 kDa uknown protein [Leveillula taurica associated noda-like virus 1]